MACYAAREPWTFFELNPAVVELAQNEQLFGEVARAVRGTSIKVGDARVRIREEPDGHFDMIVVDAFSSDAIPTHLLTREALSLFRRKLTPDGVVLINLSSRFADLSSAVASGAQREGLKAFGRVESEISPEELKAGKSASSWVLLSRRSIGIEELNGWSRLAGLPEDAWTDDLSSLLPVLRWN